MTQAVNHVSYEELLLTYYHKSLHVPIVLGNKTIWVNVTHIADFVSCGRIAILAKKFNGSTVTMKLTAGKERTTPGRIIIED